MASPYVTPLPVYRQGPTIPPNYPAAQAQAEDHYQTLDFQTTATEAAVEPLLIENNQGQLEISPREKVASADKSDASNETNISKISTVTVKSYSQVASTFKKYVKSSSTTVAAPTEHVKCDPWLPSSTDTISRTFNTEQQLISKRPIGDSSKTVTLTSKILTATQPQTPALIVSNTLPSSTQRSQEEPVPSSVIQPESQAIPAALPQQPSPLNDESISYNMGEFLSQYKLDSNPVSHLPRGLTNRSNYCYVNAILQALIACPPFYNMLKALPYQTRRGKSSTPVIDSMVEVFNQFNEQTDTTPVIRVRGRRRGKYNGAPAVFTVPSIDGSFGIRVLRALRSFPGSQGSRQEDAEEFLGYLLNCLNDEMLELMELVAFEKLISQEQAQVDHALLNDHCWAPHHTPIVDIFRGSTLVRRTRASNDDVTDEVQPFFTLPLDIKHATSIKEALELLAAKNTVNGESDVALETCLDELPDVLTLHLKCFRVGYWGDTTKIVKNIKYSNELSINPQIISSKRQYTAKQRLYKLFAVVYHHGKESTKGHYLSDVHYGKLGWRRSNDADVSRVTLAQVLNPEPPRMPYLLLYRRQD